MLVTTRTQPMSSMSGYVNYLRFVAGSTKGNTQQGTVFNDPLRLGKVDPQYTSSRVTKDYNLTAETATNKFEMNWKPVVPGTITVTTEGMTYVDDGNGFLIEVAAGSSVSRRTVMVQPVDDVNNMGDIRLEGTQPRVETVVTDATGAPVAHGDGRVDYATGEITLAGEPVQGAVQVAYSYKFIVA